MPRTLSKRTTMVLDLIREHPGQTRTWYEQHAHLVPGALQGSLTYLHKKRIISTGRSRGPFERKWYLRDAIPADEIVQPYARVMPAQKDSKWTAELLECIWPANINRTDTDARTRVDPDCVRAHKCEDNDEDE